MKYDSSGFLRPHVQQEPDPNAEQLVLQACPAVNANFPLENEIYDLTWGPVRSMRLAYASDAALRLKASSGGALSAILCQLLSGGEIDAVFHVGADPNLPIGNQNVISDSAHAVADNSGSRYCPSAPLAGLSRLRRDGRRFALVGKPCDIAAAHALEISDPDFRSHFPYLISFFCGGIPSIAGARRILSELEVPESDVAEFRYRGNGWPGKASVSTKSGVTRSMSYSRSWGEILNRHLQLRCKICPDSTGESADIVCADGWHLDENDNPDFGEHEGRSIVIGRTERGEALLERCVSDCSLICEPIDAAHLAKMQPFQAKRKQLVFSRLVAMKLCGLKTPDFPLRPLLRAARRAGLIANLRSFGGMLVRALRSRR